MKYLLALVLGLAACDGGGLGVGQAADAGGTAVDAEGCYKHYAASVHGDHWAAAFGPTSGGVHPTADDSARADLQIYVDDVLLSESCWRKNPDGYVLLARSALPSDMEMHILYFAHGCTTTVPVIVCTW